MSRRRVTAANPDLEAVVGWDPGLQTFFATVGPEDEYGEPAVWVGTSPYVLPTVDALASALTAHVTIPPLLATVLEFDRQHQLEEEGGGPWEADWEAWGRAWTAPWDRHGVAGPSSTVATPEAQAVRDEEYESFFVRVDAELAIFGAVRTWDPEAYGADPAELRLRDQGFRWCRCFSSVCPHGEGGYVHTSVMRDISRDAFDAARERGWVGRPPVEWGESEAPDPEDGPGPRRRRWSLRFRGPGR